MTRDRVRKISLGFGIFYLAIGVLGFIPGITMATDMPGHGLLLGIFEVNTIHNLVHLVAGAGLVVAGMSAMGTTAKLNWLLAAIFALLVPASLIAPVVEAVPLNVPDTLLHVASAALTAYLAVMASRAEASPSRVAI